MTTYNQQALVAQAIEGVLLQKTDFPIELHIGDDASTDDTGRICEEYAENYPSVIRYHRRSQNLGMMENLIATLAECEGDYIAICEGDDYWIDESKLQIQYNLLESDPRLSFSAHNHYILKKGKLAEAYKELPDGVWVMDANDYMRNPHFQTASYFFRRQAVPESFPEWYHDVLAGDHFLVLLIAERGNIGFINKRMSVFRTYDSSVTGIQGPLRIKENFVRHLRIFDHETEGRYAKTIKEVIDRWELVYKVYEPIGYFAKLGYLARHFGTYIRNFGRVGGVKLLAKYLFTLSVFQRLKLLLGT